jgi:myo-inositol 2-dehydrogenase/D-chiro-inositol 1-dehydrogenase
MTGFMKRFAPVYRSARTIVQAPEFGSPCLLTIDWCFGVADKLWLQSFLVDFGIHMIDLSRYMFGEVEEVFSSERHGITYAANLAFTNGAIGTINMTANRGYSITERIDLTGDYGNVVQIDSSGKLVRYHGGEIVDSFERPLAMQDSLTDIGYRGELVEFVDAIREGRQPESSIESAHKTMQVYEAICQSARDRCIVRVGEVDHGT